MLRVEHRGPYHAIGSDGLLVVALMKRPIDHALVSTLGDVLGRVLRQNDNRIIYVHITALDGGEAPEIAQVVGHYGRLMKRFSNATGAIALVTENEGFTGALVRSAFTAVMAMGRAELTGRAFPDVATAALWAERAARGRGIPNPPHRSEIEAAIAMLRSAPTGS